MKKTLSFLAYLTFVFFGCLSSSASGYVPQQGDILFQSLPHSDLVDAIEGVSKSPFSHCGLVAKKGRKWVVIEAIGPVRETALATWMKQGRGGQFWVYRFKPEFADKIPAIIKEARTHLGKPYDLSYQFDDERIYCSELVFKAFRTVTGKNLGTVRRLGEMNWKPYQAFIRSMDNGNLPLEREMITPVDLSKAEDLEFVYKK